MKILRLGAMLLAGLLFAGQADAGVPVNTVSLMTYNVHGLPWPIVTDRSAALRDIAGQLRAMRAAGRQPNIVVLQEAFVPEAKAIGRAAGYRYVAFGPDTGTDAAKATAEDRSFVADGSRFVGERIGKHVDSGLAIFSDYPILTVRRVAYPVCAGYDCLANKGALAARIAVPGVASPVTVVDTHLNSAAASGTVPARSFYAYRRQVDALTSFIASLGSRNSPMLVAGDFNVGRDPARRAYFQAHILNGPLSLQATAALCRNLLGCPISDATGVRESLVHNKDWLMFRASDTVGIRATGLGAPFGHGANGAMLSDHIGLSARYGFQSPVVQPLRAV